MSEVKEVYEGSSIGEAGELSGPLDLNASVQRSATRIFHVSELTSPEDPEERKREAMRRVGISIGDAHPTLQGAKVTGRNCRAISDSYFAVTVQYASTPQNEGGTNNNTGTRVSIGGGLKQVTAVADNAVQGLNPNTSVRYKPGAKAAPAKDDADTIEQGFAVQVTQALHTLRFVRRVTLTQNQAEQNAGTWINAISDDWLWHNGRRYTWRVMGVNYESEDQKEWTESLDLEYDGDGHNPVAYYVDPNTGKPPPDITEPGIEPGSRGNGTLRLDWYPRINFGQQFRGL